MSSGYFIDLAGDRDAVSSSARMLESRGWKGLCIGSNPHYWKASANGHCRIVGTLKEPSIDQALGDTLKALKAPRSIEYVVGEAIHLEKFPWDLFTVAVVRLIGPGGSAAALLNQRNYTQVEGSDLWIARDRKACETNAQIQISDIPKQEAPEPNSGIPEHVLENNLKQPLDEVDIFPLSGSKFKIPSGKKVVEINLGTNDSPIQASGHEVFLILVDPIPEIASKVKKANKEATVLQVAISNYSGTALFHRYKSNGGASSSLSRPGGNASWNKGEAPINVSVHTLKELLEAIPEELPIQFLKTDMQGHDLTAIKSAGNTIKRVSRILSEVYADGQSTYEGVDNSRASFVRYMKEMGFREKTPCTPGRRSLMERTRSVQKGRFEIHEGDCEFVPLHK